MVRFVYSRGGDNRYLSPFTGIAHVFVGDTPLDIKDPREIEDLRRSGAFIELVEAPLVTKVEIPIEQPKKKDPMKIGTKLKK